MFTKNKKSKLKSLLLVILLKLKPTSRIKTVRAGERDCPQVPTEGNSGSTIRRASGQEVSI